MTTPSSYPFRFVNNDHIPGIHLLECMVCQELIYYENGIYTHSWRKVKVKNNLCGRYFCDSCTDDLVKSHKGILNDIRCPNCKGPFYKNKGNEMSSWSPACTFVRQVLKSLNVECNGCQFITTAGEIANHIKKDCPNPPEQLLLPNDSQLTNAISFNSDQENHSNNNITVLHADVVNINTNQRTIFNQSRINEIKRKYGRDLRFKLGNIIEFIHPAYSGQDSNNNNNNNNLENSLKYTHTNGLCYGQIIKFSVIDKFIEIAQHNQSEVFDLDDLINAKLAKDSHPFCFPSNFEIEFGYIQLADIPPDWHEAGPGQEVKIRQIHAPTYEGLGILLESDNENATIKLDDGNRMNITRGKYHITSTTALHSASLLLLRSKANLIRVGNWISQIINDLKEKKKIYEPHCITAFDYDVLKHELTVTLTEGQNNDETGEYILKHFARIHQLKNKGLDGSIEHRREQKSTANAPCKYQLWRRVSVEIKEGLNEMANQLLTHSFTGYLVACNMKCFKVYSQRYREIKEFSFDFYTIKACEEDRLDSNYKRINEHTIPIRNSDMYIATATTLDDDLEHDADNAGICTGDSSDVSSDDYEEEDDENENSNNNKNSEDISQSEWSEEPSGDSLDNSSNEEEEEENENESGNSDLDGFIVDDDVILEDSESDNNAELEECDRIIEEKRIKEKIAKLEQERRKLKGQKNTKRIQISDNDESDIDNNSDETLKQKTKKMKL